jgi:hypothetical protein
MKTQIKLSITPVFTIICLFILWSSGCEKSPYIVDTNVNNIQAYLLSYSSESITTLNPYINSGVYLKDSALSLEYARYENLVNKVVDTNEIFLTNLLHKLTTLSTLDYGKVIISLTDLGVSYVMALSSRTEYSYNFNSSISTNKANSLDNNNYKLGGNCLINCSNSSAIKDFTSVFKTDSPNKIINIKTGQSISLSEDLLIEFAYELPEGSIITIGYGQHFIRIETLKTSASLVIFKNDMQRVLELLKKEDVQLFYIGFAEGSNIGTLKATDRLTSYRYQLPIFQFTRNYVTVYSKY